MRYLCILVCSILFFGSLVGCSVWEKSLTTTKDLYKSYLNPDPQVDLEDQPQCRADTELLARVFSPVDMQLQLLLRRMSTQETLPEMDWLRKQSQDFAWLNGLLVVDRKGSVVQGFPKHPVKQIQTDFVLDGQDTWAERQNRLLVQANPLGLECCITQPLYKENLWQGLIIAHFDPRSLARLSPRAANLMLFTPKKLLWADPAVAKTDVPSAPWSDLLSQRVSGELKRQGQDLLWLVRYVGPDPLIYAVSEAKAVAQK